MNKKSLSIVIHLILGVALIGALSAAGYFRSKYLAAKDQPPKIITKTIETDTSAKDAEIKELKKKLEELTTTKPETVITEQPKPQPQNQQNQDRRRFSLVELKEKDPERYQRIMEQRTKMNESIAKGVADKMVFFNDLDTSDMSKEELENHQKLLEKLAKMHEDTEKAMTTNDAEEIQNNMRSRWENYREVSQLMRGERDYLIMDAGRKMGFTDDEAKLLKDYVNNAYEITSGRSMFGGGRRGGGGGDRGNR